MTRPVYDERDPLPEEDHRPTSSEWAREEAKRATAEAVRKAKEAGGRL
jgi:hypothetical protein